MTNIDLINAIFEPIFGEKPFKSTTTIVDYPPPKNNFTNRAYMPYPRQAIFNRNATVVYFADGTRCIVRKSAMDEYNREHAIVYAIVKRAYGIVDPKTGIVDGNGMGNMLAKIVANGIDQVKQEEEKKAKKPVRQQKREEAKKPYRDSKGRFAVKANRKR